MKHVLASGACLAALAVAGCGGGDEPSAERAPAPVSHAAAAAGRYLHPAELRVQLGNGMRAGLYRLAVMSQHGDDSVDLGQRLPTGTVDRVACDESQPRPARGAWSWRCAVDWRTVAGDRRNTRYAVAMSAKGCFSAASRPARPARYDSTIRSYAADPLDQLASARRGC